MNLKKEVKKEIIEDVINILNQSKDEKDFMHIDNLIEEIIDFPENFKYSLSEFKYVINEIFGN